MPHVVIDTLSRNPSVGSKCPSINCNLILVFCVDSFSRFFHMCFEVMAILAPLLSMVKVFTSLYLIGRVIFPSKVQVAHVLEFDWFP